jgi:glycogen debranching enzyme
MSQPTVTGARPEPGATRGFAQRLSSSAFTGRGCTASIAALLAFATTMPPASVVGWGAAAQGGASAGGGIPRFALPASGLSLERPTRQGAFVDVVGRRAAFVGYEHRGLEAWVYPMKLLDDLRLGFTIEGYPLEIPGSDVLARITATPEQTTFTYAHSVFTVRQITFAPVDEPALVVLLDIDSSLPLRVTASFRPRLRLMWPAGLPTGNVGWNAAARLYEITEETGRFAGVIGSPLAHEGSLMPYQEEPRDVPVQFTVDPAAGAARSLVPIVIAGSVTGAADARAVFARVLGSIPALLGRNAEHYRRLVDDTVNIDTPDDRLDRAFRWAKVGVDKGLATNPLLGTGLLAGFRTSGDSERPGFAWFFGRDALWTTLAIDGYGDFATTREALELLRGFQRDDGKVPHEISQSASLIPWFTKYPYPWASADATPLFIVACADYWRLTGDAQFIRTAWPSIVKAFRFSAATDTDGDGLIENTRVGHGWVEGGALYPPHEEIYLQGVWIAALDALRELAAGPMHEAALADEAARLRERAKQSTESTYWLASARAYAYATKLPRTERVMAEPGPALERRQARLDAITGEPLFDERTVLTAVPLWWGVLAEDRAQQEIDSLGSAALATDWGHRILSNRSALYDPLSYHYGSVWPLFTGWASVGAYRYGRAQVGYQALMANALLGDANALGYVTELLSGDRQAPFGRSSHHQIWSEAMVVSPVVRGLLGLDWARGREGLTVSLRPQLPGDWSSMRMSGVPAGNGRFDVAFERSAGMRRFMIAPAGGSDDRGIRLQPDSIAPQPDVRLVLAPALPLDARVRGVSVNGRGTRFDVEKQGDSQFVRVDVGPLSGALTVAVRLDEGTEVFRRIDAAPAGASNHGLRILRAPATGSALSLIAEGVAGERYEIAVRTPRQLGALPAGVTLVRDDVETRAPDVRRIAVTFEGPAGEYARREIAIPLRSDDGRRD